MIRSVPRLPLPAEIISHAVWLDYRFYLRHRDLDDLLAKRGIRLWCRTFGPVLAAGLRHRITRAEVC